MSDSLPAPGAKVVKHRHFGEPLIGEVVSRDEWSHDEELTPDSFVVAFEDRTSRFTAADATTVGEVVHLAR